MKRSIIMLATLAIVTCVTSCQKELPEGFSDYMISQGGTGQGEDSPEISLDTNSMEFTAEGGSRSFNIKSNTSWMLSSDKSWCTVSPTSGSNNGSVMVMVEENFSTSSRTAMITVRSEIGILTVKVPQEGATSAHDYSNDYFKFVALENGTFGFVKQIQASGSLQYSLDSGATWATITGNADSPAVSAGNEIWWKGDLINWPHSFTGIGRFKSTGNFTVEGNAMSLIYGDDFVGQNDLTEKKYIFQELFSYCTGLISAENMILPAATLAEYCYDNMFYNCTNLTTAPSTLPATTLANDCYTAMFENCSSLTTAPALPATTLANRCYVGMFHDCTSLTTAPELPATTLAEECYFNMFYNCTSLTTAPQLPATTLAKKCYYNMFNGCTSLTTAPELPATTLATACYQDMFEGCTSLTTAPELPATTLATACYQDMFEGCTSLTTAPELPATTLAGYCYIAMFKGCTSLTTAPALPATTLAEICYQSMFNGCTSLTTAPSLPATTLERSCYSMMFAHCTSLTTAPSLPATTLANYCYDGMFSYCSSLKTAPALPATTLAEGCYRYMFRDCTSLNYVKCLATDVSVYRCTEFWLYNVPSSGTFVKNTSMSSWETGSSGIPSGWTVQNATPSP